MESYYLQYAVYESNYLYEKSFSTLPALARWYTANRHVKCIKNYWVWFIRPLDEQETITLTEAMK